MRSRANAIGAARVGIVRLRDSKGPGDKGAARVPLGPRFRASSEASGPPPAMHLVLQRQVRGAGCGGEALAPRHLGELATSPVRPPAAAARAGAYEGLSLIKIRSR